MSNESELLVGYSRPASDPPSTTGVWRGIVTKVNSDDFEFTVPRLSGALYTYLSTATLISPDSLTVGDEILVTFTEGRNDEIVVLGRMSLTGGSSTDPVYQGNPTTEPLGHVDRTDSLISFTDATRTFSISPVDESYEVWCANDRFIKTEEETIQIGSATGLYYIYFDADGVLSAQTDYFDWPVECPTAYVYWNGTTGLLFDERHGVTMDWQTHEYLHRTRGASIANGLLVSEYASSNESVEVANGTFFDEDLQVDIVHSLSPDTNTWEQQLQGPARIPVMYRSGTTWVKDAATNYPFKLGTTYPVYNTQSGGNWSTTEFTSNDHGIMWIVATNMLESPVISIMGQQMYSNIDDAREQTWEDMDFTGLPIVELRVLAKIIFLTNGTSANANIEMMEISDYRRAMSDATSSAAAVVSHSGLTDLSADDHTQYLLTSGTRNADFLKVYNSASGATRYGLTGGIDLESNNITGINILSPDTGYGRIYFGAPVSNTAGAVEYIHNAGLPDGYMKFRAGGADRVFILGDGRVGINDSTPSYTLDVNGTGRFTGDVITDDLTVNCSAQELYVQGSVAGVSYFDRDGTGRWVIYNSGDVLRFWDGIDEMTLDSAGNLNVTGSITSHSHNPASTNSYDLGSSSLRWRNIYTQDLHLSNGIGDYTIVEGEEDLYLTNNKTGRSFKFALIEVDPAEVPAKSEAD